MSSNDKPTVLIVGAGLGGLIFGALLEKQGLPYAIPLEYTYRQGPSSAMSVGPVLLPIFQLLGIYDEFLTIGKYVTHAGVFKETLKPYKPNDYSPIEEYLQSLLFLKQIPSHKIQIHFGHRVLNITEEDYKVTVHLSNNDTFVGDIIVGADGAYSAVRRRMYEQLKAKGLLPTSDQEDLPFSVTCLVGQTKVLDPEEYPIIKEPTSQFYAVLGDGKPYTWTIFTTAQNTICFMLKLRLDPQGSYFQSHVGGEVFKTWHSGRFVLLGDACHKLHQSGGHGAVTAIHDAIALAYLVYAMPSKTSSDFTKIFEEYQSERYPAVMDSSKNSQVMSKATQRGLVLAKLVKFRP
ncbi:hypothetical protein BGX24_001624 [Mortierella sp. AD032]|nr:hypothetical protein BGX24_001624 [Mortierella sp. AD032]